MHQQPHPMYITVGGKFHGMRSIFSTQFIQKKKFVFHSQRYNIIIRDPNQPLIVSKSKAKDVRSGADDSVSLIPELCRATGITDKMRACFK